MSDRTDTNLSNKFLKGIRRDWVDKRDLYYAPSLGTLRSEWLPSLPSFDPGQGGEPVFGLRNQGESGRCAGYALANLIDIQRSAQLPYRLTPEHQVSADMLYHMARFHDQYQAGSSSPVPMTANTTDGVRSLRSAIKGFYHHGVCLDVADPSCFAPGTPLDDRWQSQCYKPVPDEDELTFPTVRQAQAARETGLGAYYRLRPILNHYHAALNEAGTILMSANVTYGWGRLSDTGVIPYGEAHGPFGATHAAVIVGYDRSGFLVLNSWGGAWGGYRGMPGVALWTYDDWAENIVDGWVLRLGVSAPDAFDLTIGEHGTSRIYGSTRSGSIPCQELLGHYLHLDDGHHVELGAYPSSEDVIEKTLSHLDTRLSPEDPERKNYRGVVLWISGSLEGMKEAFSGGVRRKKWFQENGFFLINVFWCNDFVDQSMDVLDSIIDEAVEQAGEEAEHLDQLIEDSARGIGRAFWRDIEHAAQRAVAGIAEHPRRYAMPEQSGYVCTLLDRLTEQAETCGTSLHIVAEGAGALVLTEWLEQDQGTRSRSSEALPKADRTHQRLARKAAQITSVALSMPAIDVPRAGDGLLEFLQLLNARSPSSEAMTVALHGKARVRRPAARAALWKEIGAAPAPARIYLPEASLERRVRMGHYGKSILHLVANAFEDRRDLKPRNDPRVMLGMSNAPDAVARQVLGVDRETDRTDADPENAYLNPALTAAFSILHVPNHSKLADHPVPQKDLARNPDLEAEIMATLLHHSRRHDTQPQKGDPP